MPLLSKSLQILKLLLLGGIAGLLVLFFIPNSPVSFNWVEVNKAWSFYRQSSQMNSPLTNPNGESSLHPFSYSDAVAKAGPSVVSVKAFFEGRARPAVDGRKGDMLVDVSIGAGSGVIFDKEGYIVTNYHVIAGSFQVGVHFSNGLRKFAKIVGVDQLNDIAVLKVDIETPLAAELGRSSDVRTGDIVMAIGTPFGLYNNSVTSGIISSIDRGSLFPKIQTDAAINYGNSGGAIINTLGQVIGISSTKLSVKRSNETSISFGIPIDVVKEVFTELKLHGRVIRNWLGSTLQQLTKPGHLQLDPGIEYGTGLLVYTIDNESPSDLGGLKSGDFLIRFDGEIVKNMIQFRKQFLAVPIDKKVEIEVLRKKKLTKLSLQLKERPNPLFSKPSAH